MGGALKFAAEQAFRIPWTGTDQAALAFVRDPRRSLGRARFLRDLRYIPGVDSEIGEDGGVLEAGLLVTLPGLGSLTLPLRSAVRHTPQGARLSPLPTPDTRAGASVSGEARFSDGELHFDFAFAGELRLPEAETWGGAAFARMAGAAAERTLARVAAELPQAIRDAALAGAED